MVGVCYARAHQTTSIKENLKDICARNNSKCYSASKYFKNLNDDQSYLSVKIEKPRRVAESRPVCGSL